MKRPRKGQSRRTEKGHHRIPVRGRDPQQLEAPRPTPGDTAAPSTDDTPFTNAHDDTRTPLPSERATDEASRHARYLIQIDLRTELLLVLLRNREWIAARDVLADLVRDGLLTREWLQGLLQDPTLGKRARALVAAALEAFRQPSEGVPGKVWFPLVFPPEEGAGSWSVAPRMLTCHIAREAVPAFATSSAGPWRQRLEGVAEAVARSLLYVIPDASPRWFLDGVTFGLLRTTGLPEVSPRDDGLDQHAASDSVTSHNGGGPGPALRGGSSPPPSAIRGSDESFELAAAVAMMSAAFGQQLEHGTAAMGRVDRETGRVIPLGEPWITIKCQGFAAALPALVRVYVSRDENIERVRSLLPRVDIVDVSCVGELAMTIDVHQDEFLGMKSPSVLMRAWGVFNLDFALDPRGRPRTTTNQSGATLVWIESIV